MTFTNETIDKIEIDSARQQVIIQAKRAVFLQVPSLATEETFGKLLLTLVNTGDAARPLAWKGFTDKQILGDITGVVIKPLADVTITQRMVDDSFGAGVVIPAGENYYIPVSEFWKIYILGATTLAAQVLIEV